MKSEKLRKFYKNKKVLVLGHTGFKGSWLTACLKNYQAKVFGISDMIPTIPSNYLVSRINKLIDKDIRQDIRNYKKLKKKINLIKPDVIFHLAAQALVKKSYSNPYDTWTTNVLGTLNLLEILKNSQFNKKTVVVIITSDKCYKNINKKKGYNENNTLGDYEPYGATKASVEILFHSYFQSFLKNKKKLFLATARAGNVIGGGDWSSNRIISDVFKSISNRQILNIRYPKSTRPWQHVLEPIFGYLTLGFKLAKKEENKVNGESFNFGPNFKKNYSVIDLLNQIRNYLPDLKWKLDKKKNKDREAGLLNLDCSKSNKILKWKNILSFNETINMTAAWYHFYLKKINMQKITMSQIKSYEIILNKRFER